MHNYAALPLLYYHELIWFYTKVSRIMAIVSVTAMLNYISAANIITVYVDPIMYASRPTTGHSTLYA